MGHQIVRQPNGNFAVWSSVVDDFIMWDCTVEELVNGYALDTRQASADSAQKIRDICAKLEAGEKPYFQFTRTFEEMVEFSRLQHGETDTLRTVIELANTPVENRQIDEFADYAEDDAQVDAVISVMIAKRGEAIGNWWVLAASVGGPIKDRERQGDGPLPTRAYAIAWLDILKGRQTRQLLEEGEDFFVVAGSGAIKPRRYWVELEPEVGEAEVKAGMRGACFGSIAAIRFSGSATAAQLKKISDYILALEHDRENRTDPLREAVTPFAAEVPDEMKETYLVAGPQRPKLGDTLPKTVEDWSHMYWVTRRLRDRFRNALSEIRWTDASLDDDAPPEAMVEFLQQKIRDIKALAAEALEGK